MGQAGELNVRQRASKGAMGATVALIVLFGPPGLLKRGHDIEIKPGRTIIAYVDQDAEINTPVDPPLAG